MVSGPSTVGIAMYAVHLLFAGLWTGSVVFVTLGVLPLARDGDINAEPLGSVAGKLKLVSRTSALVLLLTGAHLGLTGGYGSVEALTSGNGHLVLSMVVLWLALGGLVEVGAGKLADGAEEMKVREPGREATRLFQAAAVVSVLLLLDGGVIAAGI